MNNSVNFNDHTSQFTVNQLFVCSPILSDLMKKVEQLTKLNRIVLEKLDPNLANHCRVLSCSENTLVLSTSSPAWGHTLRFNEMDILSTLRAYPEWSGLKSIRTRVHPSHSISEEENTVSPGSQLPSPTLTKVGAESLNTTAKQVKSQRLQDALIRLARRINLN